MQLSFFTDYSLRILMLAAAQKKEQNLAIRAAAANLQASEDHIRKVVNFLGTEGYLENRPGRQGGFRLARRPEEINLGEVVARAERNTDLVECFRVDGGACTLTPACALRSVLNGAMDAFFAVLREHSLADVMTRKLRRHLLKSAQGPP